MGALVLVLAAPHSHVQIVAIVTFLHRSVSFVNCKRLLVRLELTIYLPRREDFFLSWKCFYSVFSHNWFLLWAILLITLLGLQLIILLELDLLSLGW